jgi:hypothetical protein
MPARRALVSLCALALALTGCTVAPIDSYGDDGGLTVGVVQGRDDRGARIVAIELTNNRDDAIALTRATLDTPQLVAPTSWDRGTTLRPGLTVDLRVALGDPACPLADDITPSVTVEFVTAAGVERSVSVVPQQPAGVLDRISQEDCLIAGVEAQADITVKAVEYAPGSKVPAVLVLGIQPKEVDGSVTIVGVRATVLLGLVDPEGNLSQGYVLHRVLERGGDDSDLRISLVPNRCDTHAVAEDKRGTFIPLEVELEGGVSGTYFVTMPHSQKGQLYAFVPDYCPPVR